MNYLNEMGAPLKSQSISPEGRHSSPDDAGPSSEDPRPQDLRPQRIPTAELKPISPRVREQALPEKCDDRFFDRWAVDKARDLGARAVKRGGLDKLRKAVGAFAEWRSLRHAPAAERASMEDRALIASTPALIEKAKAEAQRLDREAATVEEKAVKLDREVEAAEARISDLRPALRGSAWDFVLILLANVVVFAVDIFIIHSALGRIPGDEQEYWLTAITMGAGAVVIGDVLGWMAAAGTVRRGGVVERPNRLTIGAVAALLILSVWFFVELGDFREFSLAALAAKEDVAIGKPAFFTIAQVVFLLAAAASCFAYVARRTGRELVDRRIGLAKDRDSRWKEVKSLRAQAEQARRTAAEAPAKRKAAEERIKSRERIAAGDAELDLKQGEYLENLIDPEYLRERADVESGARFWQLEGEGQPSASLSLALRVGAAIGAGLVGGAIAFWVIGTILATVLTGLIVTGAFAMASFGRDGDEAGEGPRRFIAQFTAAARKGSDRATDIETLVPVPSPEAESGDHANGNGNGNGHGKRPTQAELAEAIEKLNRAFGDE